MIKRYISVVNDYIIVKKGDDGYYRIQFNMNNIILDGNEFQRFVDELAKLIKEE